MGQPSRSKRSGIFRRGINKFTVEFKGHIYQKQFFKWSGESEMERCLLTGSFRWPHFHGTSFTHRLIMIEFSSLPCLSPHPSPLILHCQQCSHFAFWKPKYSIETIIEQFVCIRRINQIWLRSKNTTQQNRQAIDCFHSLNKDQHVMYFSHTWDTLVAQRSLLPWRFTS